jgi:hypothetical protein
MGSVLFCHSVQGAQNDVYYSYGLVEQHCGTNYNSKFLYFKHIILNFDLVF